MRAAMDMLTEDGQVAGAEGQGECRKWEDEQEAGVKAR